MSFSRRWSTVLAGVIISASMLARAEVIILAHSMQSIATNSSVIAWVDVLAITERDDKMKVARARVREAWKGNPGQELQFYASPGWSCDIAHAAVGDNLVLFLSANTGTSIFTIAAEGRARHEVKEVSGKLLVLTDTLEPEGMEKVPYVDASGRARAAVLLTDLRAWLKGLPQDGTAAAK